MFKRKELTATLEGLEIGATGPSRLQFVVQAEGRRVAVKMSADEARWLAYALTHWAESSETISPVRLIP
jgi:predicted DNA-binding transcriptional regulator YafY